MPTVDTESVRSSSFKEKEGDPGFLVAKGRFATPSESALKKLMRDPMLTTGDPRIPELKRKIDDERRHLEKKHVKDLASAIFMAVSNHGYATIRCIGRNANYNAVKAMSIANGYCATKGIRLTFTPSFDQGNLGVLRNEQHVDNVTAIIFTLEGYKMSDPGSSEEG
jgi:stage V sporulation protein SpoVS